MPRLRDEMGFGVVGFSQQRASQRTLEMKNCATETLSHNISGQTVFTKSVTWGGKRSKRVTDHTKYKGRNKHINLFPLDFRAATVIIKTITCYWLVCF